MDWRENKLKVRKPIKKSINWTRDVVQAADHLLCKHEVLSSKPNPTKKASAEINAESLN
jgi:hypothetical protein